MLLTATDLSKSHGARQLFRGVCISVETGDRIGLIGPNGTGKSTLLRMLASREEPDDGGIQCARGTVTVYVAQREEFAEGVTARQAATTAALPCTRCHGDVHEAEVLAAVILGKIGFDDARMDMPLLSLSGGWQKRAAIACGLASAGGSPDLLLLDEPTNHLDVEGIEWLERFLVKGAADIHAESVVFVTHDRIFLERVATRVAELSRAYPGGLFLADGNFSEFLRRKSEFLSAQARIEATLANEVRIDNAWLGRGAQARRTKAKGRIEESAERRDQLADLNERNTAAASGGARVDFNASGRRTRKLIAAHGIAKSMGGKLLFKDLDLELVNGQCLGLMGSNGSGKTTLLRVLLGELQPDAGTVQRADPPPRAVFLSQSRVELPPQTLLKDAISPHGDKVRFRGGEMHITAWSRRFLFNDDQLLQSVGQLSGGELARAHIARMMLDPADILVLDEPTNDLDLPTLAVLEESIEDFPGGVLLVTHDRAMLERLAEKIIVLGAPDLIPSTVTSLDQALRALSAFEKANALAEKEQYAAATQPTTVASTTTAAPARKKLNYNEQREFDAMETTIAKAETSVATLDKKVNAPGLSANHAAYAKACAELGAAHAAVAALYARWAELEAKRG
ncbi:MAG: ABC transporter ATP-binding protein [Phycisphaerales bacterium]|nr:ABC transporter ATP-binding protein [Phycisphaerales bacterium]